MFYVPIDPVTYRRLEQFAHQAGISIQAAASDAIENWLDITSDPRLAVTALAAIAVTQPLGERNSELPTETAAPRNVCFINAKRSSLARRNVDLPRRSRDVRTKEGGR